MDDLVHLRDHLALITSASASGTDSHSDSGSDCLDPIPDDDPIFDDDLTPLASPPQHHLNSPFIPPSSNSKAMATASSSMQTPVSTPVPAPAAPKKPTLPHELIALRAATKTFLAFFAGQAGLSLLPALLTGRLFKQPGQFLRRAFGADTTRFATSWSSLVLIFRLLFKKPFPTSPESQSLLAKFRANPFLCALVASLLTQRIDPSASRKAEIANFVGVRAVYFAFTAALNYYDGGVKKGKSEETEVKKHPEWVVKVAKAVRAISPYATFSAIMTHIVVSLLVYPQYVTPSYYKSVLMVSARQDQFGKHTLPLMSAHSSMAREFIAAGSNTHKWTYIPQSKTSREWIAETVDTLTHAAVIPNQKPGGAAPGIPEGIRHELTMCALVHPFSEKCTGVFPVQFWDGFKQGLKIYGVLHGAFLLLKVAGTLRKHYSSGNNKTSSDPSSPVSPRAPTSLGKALLSNVSSTVVSTIRSSLFMATYIATAMSLVCAQRRLITKGHDYLWMYVVATLIPSPLVVLEPRKRIIDLNLYCGGKVVESVLLWMEINGIDLGTVFSVFVPSVVYSTVLGLQTSVGVDDAMVSFAIERLMS
ncbi:hypothetical protein BJ742DRAFT_840965 [Cladochytrium replicatum]|nr:hypothetical protein BJ742DRAFT_840965 [Cladochytrium replicatum]